MRVATTTCEREKEFHFPNKGIGKEIDPNERSGSGFVRDLLENDAFRRNSLESNCSSTEQEAGHNILIQGKVKIIQIVFFYQKQRQK